MLVVRAGGVGRSRPAAARPPGPQARADAVWDEIRGVWPAVAGISNEGLASRGLQWPCLDERDPGTAVLHATAFARSARATLERIDYRASAQHIDADFPFLQVQPVQQSTYGDALNTFEVVPDLTHLGEVEWEAYRKTVVQPNVDPHRQRGQYAVATRRRQKKKDPA